MTYPVKIEFKKYGTADPWADWSQYLSEVPNISKKVESENEGEAGLIVFDSASVSLYYNSGNPVYAAFQESELSSAERYMFRISLPKSNNTYVQVYEGMADFSTISWPEEGRLVSFDIIDKLSAFSILPDKKFRTLQDWNQRLIDAFPSASYLITQIHYSGDLYCTLDLNLEDPTREAIYINQKLLLPGEYISFYEYGSERIMLVVDSVLSGGHNTVTLIYADDHDMSGAQIDDPNPPYGRQYYYTDKYFGGEDICVYDVTGAVTGFDGLKIINAIVKSQWPDINIITKPGTLTQFIIPITYQNQLQVIEPFEKSSLDALKMLADTMQVYLYFDKSGNFVIQKKDSLATNGTTRALGTTRKTDGTRLYFWDKLIDGVTINVKSWVIQNGVFLEGTSSLAKALPGSTDYIKPRNELTKEVLAGDTSITTQEALDNAAAAMASSYMSFYGNRHYAYEYDLALDDNTIMWELADNILIGSDKFFFENIDIDPMSRKVSLKLVSVQQYDYDRRHVLTALSEQAYTSSSSAGTYSSGGSSGYTGNPYLWDGGATGLNAVQARQNLGFGDMSNFGDNLISNAEFNSLDGVTSNIQTQLNNKENVLTFNNPLVRTGNQISFNYVTKNLRINGTALDTIQDIDTDATPVFAGLGIGGDAGGWELKVTGNGYLTGFQWVDSYVNGSGGFRVAGNEVISSGRLGYLQGLYVNGAYDAAYKFKSYGDAYITGNLKVDGDIYIGGRINQVNVTDLYVVDKNIILNRGGDNATAAGSGLKIEGTSASVIASAIFDGSNWNFTHDVNVASGKGYKVNNAFAIDSSRNFFGANATLSGKVSIGGATLTENLNIRGNILQDTAYKYSSLNYVSGWGNTGFELNTDGSGVSNLIVDNLTVRRTMSVYELLIRQIRATNGSEVITAGTRFKSIVLTNASTTYTPDPLKPSETITGGLYTCTIDNDDSNYITFAVNDIVMMQIWSGRSITASWGVVTSTTSTTCTIIYTGGSGYSTPAAAHTTAKGKSDWVRIGNITDTTRQGMIYLTSDDDGAPFIDVRDGVNSFAAWGSQSTKVRLGKMTGIAGNPWGNQNVYGLYADVAWLTDNVIVGGRSLGLLNGMTALFHFDDNLRDSISGSNVTYTGTLNETAYGVVSSSDNTLVCTKVNGKFGGGIAIEEATTNYIANGACNSLPTLNSTGSANLLTSTIENGMLKLVTDSSASTKYYQFGTSSLNGLSAGQTYTFSATLVSADSGVLPANISLRLYYYLSDYVGVTVPFTKIGERLSALITVPSGATQIFFRIAVAGTEPSKTLYFDNIQLEQKTYATSFTEGTRAAGHLRYDQMINTETSFSAGFWVYFQKSKTQDGGYFIEIGDRLHLRVRASGAMIFGLFTNSISRFNDESYTLADGWHWLTINYNKANNLYQARVDGTTVYSITSAYYLAGISRLSIGTGWGLSAYSNSIFDELTLFNRYLSEQEDKKLYYSGQPLQESPGMTFISGNRIRTGMLYSENYVAGVSGSMWDLNTGYLETNDGWFRGTITATSGLIGGWAINANRISKSVSGVNGYDIALDTITTVSGTDYDRPRLLVTWGDGTNSSGWGGNFISLGASSYLHTANGQFTVTGWNVDSASGGLSINVGGKNVLFAGKRGELSGAAIAGFSFDDKKFSLPKTINGTSYDIIKFGEFTGSHPDLPVDLTSTFMNDPNFTGSLISYAGSDFNTTLGAWATRGTATWSITSGYLQIYSATAQQSADTWCTFKNPSSLNNKTVLIEFDLTVASNSNYEWTPSLGVLFMDGDINGSGTNMSKFTQYLKYANNGTYHISVYVTWAAGPYKILRLVSNSGAYKIIRLDNFTIKEYTNVFTYINQNGLEVYKSPVERFSFLNGVWDMALNELSVNSILKVSNTIMIGNYKIVDEGDKLSFYKKVSDTSYVSVGYLNYNGTGQLN